MAGKTGSKKSSKRSTSIVATNRIEEHATEYMSMSNTEVPTLISIIRPRKPKKKIRLNNREKVYKLMQFLEMEDREKLYLLHLDINHDLLLKELISIGDITFASVPYRSLFKAAIISNATRIICVHNHPTGNPTPSHADYDVSRRIVEMGILIGIQMVDHVIIGHGDYSSALPEGIDTIAEWRSK